MPMIFFIVGPDALAVPVGVAAGTAVPIGAGAGLCVAITGGAGGGLQNTREHSAPGFSHKEYGGTRVIRVLLPRAQALSECVILCLQP